MNRLVVKVFALFCLAALGYGQPKLSLDKTEVDLGIIYSGDHKSGAVTLRNIGNETLNITGVYPSCGCTAVKYPKSFLKPGESDELMIDFNSTGYVAKAEKHISITTNDPTSANVDIKLIIDVRMEIEPVSHSLLAWLGTIPVGKSGEQTVSFKNISNHPITIRDVKGSSPLITVSFEKKTIRPDETFDVIVKAKPEKRGYTNEHITIETDSKNQPQVELRVPFIGTIEN